ncbi:MAG TPA: zinc ribbon domain-containing protein [Burkholderiaceae bacterium]|nr:zinc ribbon domain-containing protein [Burkholderiaceae bacterium]
MPTYDYDCPHCGSFEALRRIALRDEACACPACGMAAARVFVHAPRLELLTGDTRHALQLNERAAHQPRSSSDGPYGRLRHPAGCGCCSGSRRNSATVTGANGAKAFPTKRPWMISH